MKQDFSKSFRINDQIKAKEVRVIDEEGTMLGVLNIIQAIKLAEEAGLDLVEVSPNSEPPVCKIANFGKMKYEMQKKASDSKRKQKVIDVKEIKMSLNIGKSDYEFKIKHLLKFIAKGDKVKLSIKMKGREVTHLEFVNKMMNDIINDVKDYAKFETEPKMEGKQMVVTLIKK